MEFMNTVIGLLTGPMLWAQGPLVACVSVIALVIAFIALVWGVAILVFCALTLALIVAGFCFVGLVCALEYVATCITLKRAKSRA